MSQVGLHRGLFCTCYYSVFSLFNDLGNKTESSLIKSVDDHKVGKVAGIFQDGVRILTNYLDKLDKWSEINGIYFSFNLIKTI